MGDSSPEWCIAEDEDDDDDDGVNQQGATTEGTGSAQAADAPETTATNQAEPTPVFPSQPSGPDTVLPSGPETAPPSGPDTAPSGPDTAPSGPDTAPSGPDTATPSCPDTTPPSGPDTAPPSGANTDTLNAGAANVQQSDTTGQSCTTTEEEQDAVIAELFTVRPRAPTTIAPKPPRNVCPICQLVNVSHVQLIFHISQHMDVSVRNKNKPTFAYNQGNYHCTSCNLLTPHRVVFYEHVRCHTKLLPYTCTHCQKGFISVSAVCGHHLHTHAQSMRPLKFELEPSPGAEQIMGQLGPQAPPSNVQSPLLVAQPGESNNPSQPEAQMQARRRNRITGVGATFKKAIVIDDSESSDENDQNTAAAPQTAAPQAAAPETAALQTAAPQTAAPQTAAPQAAAPQAAAPQTAAPQAAALQTAAPQTAAPQLLYCSKETETAAAAITGTAQQPTGWVNLFDCARSSDDSCVNTLTVSSASTSGPLTTTSAISSESSTLETGPQILPTAESSGGATDPSLSPRPHVPSPIATPSPVSTPDTCASDDSLDIVSVSSLSDNKASKYVRNMEVKRRPKQSTRGGPPPKKDPTTLECFFKDGYYQCRTCMNKLKSLQNFRYHVYYHLHAEKSRPCGHCKQKGLVEDHQRVPCAIVENVMKMLKEQKKAYDEQHPQEAQPNPSKSKDPPRKEAPPIPPWRSRRPRARRTPTPPGPTALQQLLQTPRQSSIPGQLPLTTMSISPTIVALPTASSQSGVTTAQPPRVVSAYARIFPKQTPMMSLIGSPGITPIVIEPITTTSSSSSSRSHPSPRIMAASMAPRLPLASIRPTVIAPAPTLYARGRVPQGTITIEPRQPTPITPKTVQLRQVKKESGSSPPLDIPAPAFMFDMSQVQSEVPVINIGLATSSGGSVQTVMGVTGQTFTRTCVADPSDLAVEPNTEAGQPTMLQQPPQTESRGPIAESSPRTCDPVEAQPTPVESTAVDSIDDAHLGTSETRDTPGTVEPSQTDTQAAKHSDTSDFPEAATKDTAPYSDVSSDNLLEDPDKDSSLTETDKGAPRDSSTTSVMNAEGNGQEAVEESTPVDQDDGEQGNDGASVAITTEGTQTESDGTLELEAVELEPHEEIGDESLLDQDQDDSDADNAILEDPTDSAVLEDPTDSAVLEDPTDSAVLEDPTDSAVLEDPTDSAVLEDPTDSAVLEDPTDSAVLEDPSDSAVPEDPSDSAVPEDPTDSAVLEDPTVNAVLEDPTDRTVLEDHTDNAVLEDPVDNAALVDPVDNAVLEDPAGSNGDKEHSEVSDSEKRDKVTPVDQDMPAPDESTQSTPTVVPDDRDTSLQATPVVTEFVIADSDTSTIAYEEAITPSHEADGRSSRNKALPYVALERNVTVEGNAERQPEEGDAEHHTKETVTQDHAANIQSPAAKDQVDSDLELQDDADPRSGGNTYTRKVSCGQFKYDAECKRYHCLACNFKSEKRQHFRRHIWRHVHGHKKKSFECNHYAGKVAYNKFNFCLITKNIMRALDHVKVHGLARKQLDKEVAEINEEFRTLPCAQTPPDDDELLIVDDFDSEVPEKDVADELMDSTTQEEDNDVWEPTPLSADDDNRDIQAKDSAAVDSETVVLTPLQSDEESTGEGTDVCRRCMTYERKTTQPPAMVNQAEQPPSDGFYICGFDSCKFSSASDEDFKVHNLVKHASEYSYPCNYCPNAFADEDQLISHMVCHKGGSLIQIYKCGFSDCDFATNMQADFKGHYLHNHADESLFPCCYCQEKYTSPDLLLDHVQTHVAKYALCPYCSTRSQMRIEIVRHIALEHKNEPRRVIIHTEIMYPGKDKEKTGSPSGSDKAAVANGDADKNGESTSPAELPEKTTDESAEPPASGGTEEPSDGKAAADILREEQTPSPSSSTAADLPRASGASRRKSKPVKRVWTEEEIAASATQAPVEEEFEDVKGARYDCTKCNFQVPAKVALSEHEEIHNADVGDVEHAFKCSLCPYRCSDQKQFTGHVQFHQGTNRVRVYQCTHCDFSTNQMPSIEDHLFDIHPDDPFKFEVSGTRTEHMQETNACVLCYQVYASQSELLEHVGLVHEPQLSGVMHLFDQLAATVDEDMDSDAQEEYASGSQETAQHPVYQPLIDRFHCDYCEFDTSSRATLVEHVNDVHGQALPSFDDDTADNGDNAEMIEEDEDEETTDITDKVKTAKPSSRRGRSIKQCPYCPFRSERVDNFMKHQEIHERNKNLQNGYKCGHCQLIQPKRAPILAHLKKYHPGMDPKITTIGKGSVPQHLRVNKPASAVPEEPLPKRPRVVPARYTSPYSTTSVSPSKVPRMTEAVPALPKQLTASSSLEQCLPDGLVFRYPIQCPHCTYSTKVRMNLIRHVKSHGPTAEDMLRDSATPSSSRVEPTDELAPSGESEADSSSEEDDVPGSKVPDDYTDFSQKVPHMDLYKCKECVFMHRYPSKVRRHFYYKHAKYNPYQCVYCDFGAVESGKVKRHCHLMHKDLPVKVIKRSLKPLPEGFESSVSFMPETRSADDIEFEEGPGGKDEEKILARYIMKKPGNIQECRCCGYSQEGASSLKRHVLAMHMQFYPYACKYCNAAMLEINKVKIHIDKAHPGQPYKIVRRKLTADTANIDDLSDAGSAHDEEVPKIKQEVDDSADYGEAKSTLVTPQTKLVIKFESGSTANNGGESMAAGERLVNFSDKKKKKLSRCMYCGYTSHWNIKDVKLHIFRVHQRKNPFMCGHCGYGNVIRERVRNHCKSQHPAVAPIVRDKRKGMDSIMPLEETEEHMMVGVMTPSGVPITDLQQLKASSPMKSPQRLTSRSSVSSTSPMRSPPRLALPKAVPQSTAYKVDSNGQPQQAVSDAHVTKDSKQWYLCKVCQQYGTHHLDNLLYHILARHQQQKPYKCKHCEVSKWRRGDVHVHIEQMHPGKNIEDVLYMVREKRRVLLQYVSLAPKTAQSPQSRAASAARQKPAMSRTFAAAQEQKRKYAAAALTYKKTYTCHLCGQGYATAKVLWAHRRTHYTYRPFGCMYCTFTGFYSAYVLQHCLKVHPTLAPQVKKIDKPTIMEIDQSDKRVTQEGVALPDTPQSPDRINSPPPVRSPPMRFTDSAESDSAAEGALPDASPQKNDFAMKCDHCGVLRPHQQGMEVHQSKAHAGLPVSYHIIESNAPEPHVLLEDGVTPADGQCMLSCKQCSFTSRLSTVMRHHLMAHMDYKPYACSYCKFRAVRSYAIKVHLQRIHPAKPGRIVRQINKDMEAKLRKGFNRYALDTTESNDSSTIMTSPEGLRSPNAREVVMNSCKHCSFKSKNSTIIRHHVMAHLQYKPYSCGYCNLQSIRPYDVKTHSMKMHPGNPPRTVHRKDDEMEELVKNGFDRHVGSPSDEFFMDDPTPPNTFKQPVMPKLVPAPNSPTGTSVVSNVTRRIKQEFGTPAPMMTPTTLHRTPPSASRGKKDQQPKMKVEYHCSLCGVKKVSRVDIERHLMWDINYKPISCPYCPYRQVLICDVKRHVTTKHKDMPLKILRKNNPIHELRLAELVAASTRFTQATPSPAPSPATSTSSGRSLLRPTPPATPTPPPQIQSPPPSVASPTLRSVLSAPPAPLRIHRPTARKSIRPSSPAQAAESHPRVEPIRGFPCKECEFVAATKKYLSNHMIRHRPKKYQCSYCEQRVHYPHEMMTHLYRKHQDMPVKFEKLISTDSRLSEEKRPQMVADQELQSEASGSQVGGDPIPLQPKPKRAFNNKGRISGALVLDGMILDMTPLQDLKGNFMCDKCDYKTHKLKNLKVHWVQHGAHRWKCGLCEAMFHTIPILKRHCLKLHPGCEPVCDNMITGEKGIYPGFHAGSSISHAWDVKKASSAPVAPVEEDMESEASGQVDDFEEGSYAPTEASSDYQIKYNCTLCWFRCTDDEDLLEHMNEEHAVGGDKVPLRCGFCSFTTYNDVTFEEHIQNHRIFKPYQCAHCGYENFTRSKVKFHCMRMHSDLPILIMEQAQTFGPPRISPDRSSSASGAAGTRRRITFQPMVELNNVAAMPEELLDQLLEENGVDSVTW